jgi:hypothetical protein
MKHAGNFLAALLLLATLSFGQTKWVVEKSHSNINFTVAHLVDLRSDRQRSRISPARSKAAKRISPI